MDDLAASIITMRPFLPAKDFETSCRFYEAIGFSVTSLGDKIAHVEFGGERGRVAFLLQDFYVKEFAENLMMHLLVRDLDAWWRHIAGLALEKHFAVPPPRPPALQSWGMYVAYFWDPAGVLWHIALETE